MGRPYARSICSILPLYMESNVSVAKNFCTNSFNDSTDCQNLWYCGLISLKIILIFPTNFCNFRFDIVEKQSIINPSNYRSKSYASLVLGDSEVTFLREGEDAAFCPSLYCILFIYSITKLKKSLNFLVFHTFGSILLRPAAFRLLSFISSTLSSSSVNCQSWMSSWLLIIFMIGLSMTLGEFPSRFWKCSIHIWIHFSWMAAFSFAFEVLFLLLTLFSAFHAIYDCSIFYILLIWHCSFWYVLVLSGLFF